MNVNSEIGERLAGFGQQKFGTERGWKARFSQSLGIFPQDLNRYLAGKNSIGNIVQDRLRARGGLLALSGFLSNCNHFDHDLRGLAASYKLSPSQCSRLRQTMFKAYYVPRPGVIEMIIDEINSGRWAIENAEAFLKTAQERELALKEFAETLGVMKIHPAAVDRNTYYP